MKIETWADLKEFANSLSDEQLDNPVIWWGDERGGKFSSADTLKEDYVNESGEGVEPIYLYKGDEDFENIQVVLKKGTPILQDDIIMNSLKRNERDT